MRLHHFIALCALLGAGCQRAPQNGYAVDLTIVADSSLSDGVVASMRALTIAVSGAESASTTSSLTTPFSDQRQERVVYRPAVAGGDLLFSAATTNGAGAIIASGQSSVTLRFGATVTSTLTLLARAPLLDGGELDAALDGSGHADLAALDSAVDDLGEPDLGEPDLAAKDLALSDLAAVDQGGADALSPCGPGSDGAVCAPTANPCELPGLCANGVCGAKSARPDGYNFAPGYLNRCCGGLPVQINSVANCGACGLACGVGQSCSNAGAVNAMQLWCTCKINADCAFGCCSGGQQCTPSLACGVPLAPCIGCPGNASCTVGNSNYCHY